MRKKSGSLAGGSHCLAEEHEEYLLQERNVGGEAVEHLATAAHDAYSHGKGTPPVYHGRLYLDVGRR